MRRIALMAALVVGLTAAVPSAAQVGGGKIVFAAENGISTINADGSGLSHVRGPCLQTYGCRYPVWSPDGSQFAFVADNRLNVMAADGSGERTIYTSYSPPNALSLSGQAWSPDGQSIAFADYGGLLVVTLDGSRRWIASGGPAPAWSPDGSKIAFYRASDHGLELSLVDPMGGVPSVIATTPFMKSPVWSPDSRMLAFAGGVELPGGPLSVVGVDGTGLRQVSRGGTDAPAWSPDGRKIAFVKTVAYYDAYPYRDVHVVEVDGTGERRLTYTFFGMTPSWAPDGKQILFSSNGTPATMNADGGCLTRLLSGVYSSWDMGWQPLSHGPFAGPKECHSLTVRATATPSASGTAAFIAATVLNSGSESLTRVRLVPPSSGDFTPTRVTTTNGRCSVRRDLVHCAIGTLAPGEEALVVIRADARRIGPVDEGTDTWLSFPLAGRAAEPSIDPQTNAFDVRIALVRCSTGTPGGSTIVGTDSPEHICGRRGADLIDGKGGRDRIDAGAGGDVVLSRDRERDVVRCGPGQDSVVADRMDAVASDCERVIRR